MQLYMNDIIVVIVMLWLLLTPAYMQPHHKGLQCVLPANGSYSMSPYHTGIERKTTYAHSSIGSV